MPNGNRSNRRVSAGLITAGIVLLVVAGGYLVACQGRAAQTRLDLSQTPPVAATSAPVAQPTEMASVVPPATPVAPELTQSALPSPESLLTETPIPAGSATAPSPATTAVVSATAVADRAPARVVIPDLKLDVPVVEMGWRVVQTANGPRSDWVIPKNQAGHHINSAMLGDEGNIVISGHNNIYGQVFKPISFAWDNASRVQVDNFTDQSAVLNGRTVELFDATGREFKYTISGFYRLKDTGVSTEQRIANARFMEPTDQAQVTIITCWPPTSNTHRLVVVAVPATN
jgi:hypothetical protein